MRTTYTCPMCASMREGNQGDCLFCEPCKESGYTVLMEPPLEHQYVIVSEYLAKVTEFH